MKIEKVEKFLANLHEKIEYDTHVRNLKLALTHRLVLTKVHRSINFSQGAWLKSHLTMNT